MKLSTFEYVVIFALFIGVGVFFNYLNELNKRKNNKYYIYEKNEKFLTEHELYYYKELLKIIDINNHTIIAKVRLADLFHPKKGQNKEISAFNKIKSKHIDFVVCNKEDLQPLLLIEIDDKSHNSKKRKERDIFIDKIADDTNTKLIHIKNIDQINAVAYLLNL